MIVAHHHHQLRVMDSTLLHVGVPRHDDDDDDDESYIEEEIVEDEETQHHNEDTHSLYEVENEYPKDYIDIQGMFDHVMKQLPVTKKKKKNSTTTTNNKSSNPVPSDNGNMVVLQRSSQDLSKGTNIMKKYKFRQDPYMEELREKLSKRYRWETVTESDGTSTKIGAVPWNRQEEEEADESSEKNGKATDATATTVTAATISDGSVTTTGSKSSVTPSTVDRNSKEMQTRQNPQNTLHGSYSIVNDDTHGYSMDDDEYTYEQVESTMDQSPRSIFRGRPNLIPTTTQSAHSDDDFTYQTYHSYEEETIGYEEKPKLFSNIEIIVVETGNESTQDGYNRFIDGDDDVGPYRKKTSKANDYNKINRDLKWRAVLSTNTSTSEGCPTSAHSSTPLSVDSLIFDTSAQQQQQQQQQQWHDYHFSREDEEAEPPAMTSEPSSFQLEYRTEKRSVLHDFLKERNWSGMTQCLGKLKVQNMHVIRQELTRLSSKRQSTPLHVAVAKAPRQVTTLLISLIPPEFRGEILTLTDSEGNTPLHIACQTMEVGLNTSFTSIVKVLMLGVPRVHRMQNYKGDTPLSLLLASPSMRTRRTLSVGDFVEAVAEDLIESMLKDNASLLRERNDSGRTPLHMAAANCVHDRILKILLDTDEGASAAQLSDRHGMLPLHYLSSCASGRIPAVKSVKRLLDAYPQGLSHASSTGDTPLHLFVSNITRWIKDETDLNDMNTEYLVQILAGGPNTRKSNSPLLMRNNDTLSPLHCCIRFETPLNVVSALAKKTFFARACMLTDSETATPLHLICASSNPQSKLGLINVVGTAESAAAKDNNGKTPLLLAVENPNTTKKVIRALGEVNAEAAKMEDATGRLPFHFAIRKKAHESIIKAILKLYPKAVKVAFDCKNNIFHEMCQYETAPGIISGLLQVYPEGAQGRNTRGNIPLHVAVGYKCSLKAVEALITAYPEGCMVQNKSNELPLHFAADDDTAHEAVIECLLKAAPQSILNKDKKGRTPLDRGREAKVGMAAYGVLQAYFKEQKEKEKLELRLTKKSPSAKIKKKKVKKEDLIGSTTSIDFHVTLGEDSCDSSTSLDLNVMTSKSIKIKNKVEKDHMSMDTDVISVELHDLYDDERDSLSSGDLGASLSRSTKSIESTKTKKHKEVDPSESSTRKLLDQDGGPVSFDVAVTPKNKKKKKKKKKDGTQDNVGFDDSTSPANGKRKKKMTKDRSSTRSPSRTRRPTLARKENEEGVVDSDSIGELVLATLKTPKTSKNHVDGILRTPRSVSSKANRTPTSSVVKRGRRLKSYFSSTSDGFDEKGEATVASSVTRTSRSRSVRSPRSRSKSLSRSKKRSKSSGRLQNSKSHLAGKSPVLPDLMTPSPPKTYHSNMLNDILSTGQLGGESMAFLPPLWAKEEVALE